MQIKELRKWGESELAAAGINAAEADVRLLLTDALKMDFAGLLCHAEDEADPAAEEVFREGIAKRAARVPLQHILGEAYFMGLPFRVSEDVLIPRFDTEVLVEEALPLCEGADVLDVGTGSGCIAVSLSKLGRCRSVTACDISGNALAVARENAARNQAEVQFLKSDLFSGISGSFDVIVSNPPYIPTDEIEGLAPEVALFDPRLALDGGSDGLLFYRRLAEEAKAHLRTHGFLVLEIGFDQASAVSELLRENGFTEIRVRKDYAGLDRVVSGRLG